MKHSLKRTLALVLSLVLVFSSAASAISLLDKLKEKKNEMSAIDISGIYYGSIHFFACTGEYAQYEESFFDAYMLLAADETGTGDVRLYLNHAMEMFLQGSCRYEEGSIVVDTLQYAEELQGSPLCFTTGSYPDLYGTYGTVRSEAGSFDFNLAVRPYGALWEDVAMNEEDAAYVPAGYADYLDYLEEGLQCEYFPSYCDMQMDLDFRLVGPRHPLHYGLNEDVKMDQISIYDKGEAAVGYLSFNEDLTGTFFLGGVEEAFTYDESSLYFESIGECEYSFLPGGRIELNIPGEHSYFCFGEFSRYGRYIPAEACIDGEWIEAPAEKAKAYFIDIYPEGNAFIRAEENFARASYTEDSFTADGETVNLQFFDGWLSIDDGETTIRFIREDNSLYDWMAYSFSDALNAPFVSEYRMLEAGTDFYGTMLYENFEDLGGGNSYGDRFDVKATFGSTRDGDLYFEVYDYEDPDNVLFSMWVEQEENVLYPIIGEEDAWIYNLYLSPEQGEDLVLRLVNGAIEFSCPYEQEGVERIEIRFFLRPLGSSWDLTNDPLPPDFEDYSEEYLED